MRPDLRLAAAALAAAVLSACSSPSGEPALGPPDITTASLPHAYKGLALTQQLEATAATPPVTWSFAVAKPASLSWLSLSTNGVLSGMPPDVLAGESITVRATDGASRWSDKTFTVVVDLCKDGDQATCTFASGTACTVGTATCSGAQFGSCVGSPSADASYCGATCSACGATADSCSAGTTCRCGSGDPCAGTNATSAACTGGTCVNVCSAGFGDCDNVPQNGCETPTTTLTNCGGCNVPCNAPANGTASCGTGSCLQSCPSSRVLQGSTCVCNTAAGYTDCSGTCVLLSSSTSNCGYCGNVCPHGLNEVATCISGVCGTRCASGYSLCNGFCVLTGDCVTCFVAGTPVTMADGSSKAIEEVVAGERVLAMDVETRTLAEGVVAHPIAHPTAPALLRINGRITTTPEHRFFVAGRWIASIELRLGDALVTAEPGPAGFSVGTEIVTQLELLDGGVPTYNLEIEGLHDYFAEGVLVHNLKQIP